ncbi:MAG: hypothetical protein L0229_01465 [Blastocatellia bacterium]|nr:hypothetical protein [Blastocatellia bacterium]
MTPTLTLISVGIALMTIILSIFGASWLNQRAIEKHTDLLREMLAAQFKAIDARFDVVDARFAAVEARFAAVEARLDRIERQLDAVFKPSLPK